MSFSGPRACAVCGRVLTYVRASQSYEHGPNDSLADHLPVPVALDEIGEQLRARCDFCSGENPTHSLGVNSFSMPGFQQIGSVADWAACGLCAALIERNEWNALVRRAKSEWEKREGPQKESTEATLKILYRELRKNITSPIKPIGK